MTGSGVKSFCVFADIGLAARISFDGVAESVKVEIRKPVTAKDLEVYEGFIKNVLSDVAERRTDGKRYLRRGTRRWVKLNGERRRIFVHGEHICYQDGRFRQSDTDARLSVALEAAEIIEANLLPTSWGSHFNASVRIAEAVLNSACKRLSKQFLHGAPRRGEIGKLLPVSADRLNRLADTIRRRVRYYRRKNPAWQAEFDWNLEMFRSGHCRDAQWYRTREICYLQWLSEFEKRDNFEWCEATPVVGFARLYQEQDKFDQAIEIYRKAMSLARRAVMNDEFRPAMLRWLHASVEACQRKADPLPDPVYSGPRTNVEYAGLRTR